LFGELNSFIILTGSPVRLCLLPVFALGNLLSTEKLMDCSKGKKITDFQDNSICHIRTTAKCPHTKQPLV